jgi:ADP-ribose pyrophosphatase YjhB (NUDIX family)
LIRNASKAILIHDNKLLTIKYQDEMGIFYSLPGGGQEYGETIIENLRRECKEEVGLDVLIGDLLFVRELIDRTKNIHQVEFIFLCSSNSIERACMGELPDAGQLAIEWLPLSNLMDYRLYPLEARNYIKDISKCKTTFPVYLGAK